MLAISQSEIRARTRCPRQWFILYYLGYAPATEPVTGNRLLGVRIHTALEGYYGYDLDPRAVLATLYAIEIKEHPEYEAELKAEYDLAEAMVAGYLEWLSEEGADADLRVVQTECEVRVPLPGLEGVELRSRMDQVNMSESEGTLSFMDYKTAADFEKHGVLELDPQMPFYCLVQQLLVSGMQNAPVVNGGQITTLRRVKRTSRSQPPYYQRDRFRYNPAKMSATYFRVLQVCTEIKNDRQALDQMFSAVFGTTSPAPEQVMWWANREQQTRLRPVPLLHDCKWSCPLSAGLCAMMDDGSDWLGALWNSGAWKQVDPYAYYRDDALTTIRAALGQQ